MEEDKTESTSLESTSLEGGADSTSSPAGGETPGSATGTEGGNASKPTKVHKSIFHRINVYFMGFILLLVIAAVVSGVMYLNSQKESSTPNIVNQNLTPEDLKELSTANSTIGDTGQTLTVQGNAIFSGQVLSRGDLNVAGDLKTGGDATVRGLTTSGPTNLNKTQAQSLQVAQATTLKGAVTLQSDLNVAGSTTLNGPVTARQLTVTNLILSGNASLSVPNHIAFPGASPGRSINHGVLGGGGSASVDGSDTTGTVNVNTGGSTGSGCFVTLTFRKQYTRTPHIIVSPVGRSAGKIDFYVDRSVSSFSICSASNLPAATRFSFDYFVTN